MRVRAARLEDEGADMAFGATMLGALVAWAVFSLMAFGFAADLPTSAGFGLGAGILAFAMLVIRTLLCRRLRKESQLEPGVANAS